MNPQTAERQWLESEAGYRNLFAGLSYGVVFQDAGGRVLWANPAAQRILGLSLDQLQGRVAIDPGWRTVREDGTPLPGAGHPGMVALTTGRPTEDLVMGVCSPGREAPVWISVNAVPLFRPLEATPFQVQVSLRDITPWKTSETGQKEAQTKLGAALENMADAVFITDLQVSLIDFNEAYATFHRFRNKAECARTVDGATEFTVRVALAGECP